MCFLLAEHNKLESPCVFLDIKTAQATRPDQEKISWNCSIMLFKICSCEQLTNCSLSWGMGVRGLKAFRSTD